LVCPPHDFGHPDIFKKATSVVLPSVFPPPRDEFLGSGSIFLWASLINVYTKARIDSGVNSDASRYYAHEDSRATVTAKKSILGGTDFSIRYPPSLFFSSKYFTFTYRLFDLNVPSSTLTLIRCG